MSGRGGGIRHQIVRNGSRPLIGNARVSGDLGGREGGGGGHKKLSTHRNENLPSPTVFVNPTGNATLTGDMILGSPGRGFILSVPYPVRRHFLQQQLPPQPFEHFISGPNEQFSRARSC